jgi:Apea-like HEPN
VDPRAATRMKELVLQGIQLLNVENSELQFATAYDQLGALGEFIAKNFGQWLREERARLYAFDALEHAVKASGHMPVSGRLMALTPQQREQIADLVCEMWARIPVTYQFVFPLPVMGQVDEVIEITPGIAIKNSPRDMVDEMGMQLPRSLGALALAASDPPVASLVVEAKGLMQYSALAEVPAAVAIRAAKVVIQLGLVEKILDLSGWLSQASPRESKYTPRIGLPTNTGAFELPATFAMVLAEISLTPKAEASYASRFATIGAVLRREAELQQNPPKKARKESSEEIYARQIRQHCARIATAAEWLFDAEHAPESATTVVQTAIAYEALYGGGQGEPVVATLANRLAYALGKSPQFRESLREWFTDFYKNRSDVVHNGASRLTGKQRHDLSIMRNILHQALAHELDLLKQAGHLALE